MNPHHDLDPTASFDADEARIDALARSAADELRRPAPANGFAGVRRAGRQRQLTRVALSGTAALLLVGGGIALTNRNDPTLTVEPAQTAAPRSAPEPAAATTPASVPSQQAPGNVEFRAVLGRAPWGASEADSLLISPTADRDAPVQLMGSDSETLYRLGPVFGSNSDMIRDAQATFQDGEWTVNLTLTSTGLSTWNSWATECFERASRCPDGGMAVVLSDAVVSAPVPQVPSFDSPQLIITGSLTEAAAATLATRLAKASSIEPTGPMRLPLATPELDPAIAFGSGPPLPQEAQSTEPPVSESTAVSPTAVSPTAGWPNPPKALYRLAADGTQVTIDPATMRVLNDDVALAEPSAPGDTQHSASKELSYGFADDGTRDACGQRRLDITSTSGLKGRAVPQMAFAFSISADGKTLVAASAECPSDEPLPAAGAEPTVTGGFDWTVQLFDADDPAAVGKQAYVAKAAEYTPTTIELFASASGNRIVLFVDTPLLGTAMVDIVPDRDEATGGYEQCTPFSLPLRSADFFVKDNIVAFLARCSDGVHAMIRNLDGAAQGAGDAGPDELSVLIPGYESVQAGLVSVDVDTLDLATEAWFAVVDLSGTEPSYIGQGFDRRAELPTDFVGAKFSPFTQEEADAAR